MLGFIHAFNAKLTQEKKKQQRIEKEREKKEQFNRDTRLILFFVVRFRFLLSYSVVS